MKRMKRRLTAVMCADVAHYSTLMEADDEGTLAQLKACRELMIELVESHDGRFINSWGDAVIFEFTSITEAVRCAVEIQKAIAARNVDLPSDRRMDFRIGINLGDLLIEGDDIYGEGVNVAARLQEVAPIGGILVSSTVHDQVRHLVGLAILPVGPVKLRNIGEPVDVFAIRPPGSNLEAMSGAVLSDKARRALPSPQTEAEQAHQSLAEQAQAFLRRQPRRLRACLMMVGFFFFLNLVTSGLSNLWFYWPSLPFLLPILWTLLGGRSRKHRSAFQGGQAKR